MMAERFARGFSPGGELSERCASRAALAPERGEVKCGEARAERGVLRGVSPRIEPQRRVELVRAPVEICMTRSRPSGDMGVTAGTDLAMSSSMLAYCRAAGTRAHACWVLGSALRRTVLPRTHGRRRRGQGVFLAGRGRGQASHLHVVERERVAEAERRGLRDGVGRWPMCHREDSEGWPERSACGVSLGACWLAGARRRAGSRVCLGPTLRETRICACDCSRSVIRRRR